MKRFYIRVVSELADWFEAEDEETAVESAIYEAEQRGYDVDVEDTEEFVDELDELEEGDDVD